MIRGFYIKWSTGYPKIKVPVINFNSELPIALLHSFLTSLDSVPRYSVDLKVKLLSFFRDVFVLKDVHQKMFFDI